MRYQWTWLVAVTASVSLIAAVPSPAAPSGPDALRADLDEILADPRLDGAHAGVEVRELSTGETLYARQSEQRATPASNAKLATAAAALESLGEDYRFRTEVVSDAPRERNVLDGDLVLRGTGDPTMLAADYDRLAADVADSGIERIAGRLRVDDSSFDQVPLGTGWAWDDEPHHYAAPVSALTVAANTDYDAGSVTVRVRPAAEGEPARVAAVPNTDALRLVNRTETAPAGSESTLGVQREHGSDKVVVTGNIPADAPLREELASVEDPSTHAAGVFTDALRRHGVRVGEPISGRTPPGTRELASHDSMPLRELLVPFLKLSNNGHAEALVKAMGYAERGEGSWDAGLAVLRERLAELGVDAEQFRLVDGSGLSSMDTLTPHQLTTVLSNARQRPWFPAWHEALPVAGADDRLEGGTLRGRMIGTAAEGAVRAKTGSLTGASSLSGYVTSADGRELAFSVLLNDYVSAAPQDLEDAIAIRLAKYGGEGDRRAGAPGQSHSGTAERRADEPSSGEPARPGHDPWNRVTDGSLECSWVKTC